MSGLENVTAAETRLSDIDGRSGRLMIREKSIEELSRVKDFETAVYYLWNGHLPESGEYERFRQQMFAVLNLNDERQQLISRQVFTGNAMGDLMAGIAALDRKSFQWPPTVDEALDIMGFAARLLEERRIKRSGGARLDLQHDGFAANFLRLVTGEEPLEEKTDLLNTYFISTMEHGLNASTFTARVICSTESDMASAVAGAIGAMKGPLHGGAPTGVIEMLEAVSEAADIDRWLEEKILSGEKLMGFGHRVYKTYDPRAAILKEKVKKHAGDDPWLTLAEEVEGRAEAMLARHKHGRALYANVEFYAAAVFKMIGFTPDIYSAVFTTARIAGWAAHIIEQSGNNRIYRPKAKYIGVK